MCLIKPADTLRQKLATMKLSHVLGIILAVVFIMVWCFQIWSSGHWKAELQGQGDGSFYENKRTNANVEAFAREVFKDGSRPVISPTDVSGSWESRLLNKMEDCVRAIKRVGHRILHHPRPAPPGVYFTLIYISVRDGSGVTGVEPGTRVVLVRDEGPWLLVKEGNLEFEAERQYLTNDLDVADLALSNDAEAKQAVASYIARQQQALDQRDEKRKTQALGRH